MSGFVALGVTPRQALFLEAVGGFDVCFAAMSWLAKRLGVTPRHAFRIQAELKERGLLSSVRPPRHETPPQASKSHRLTAHGWAVRALAGPAAVIQLAKRAAIDAARRTKSERLRAERERKRAERERKRAERRPDADPPPPPPANHREFPRDTGAPSGPVSAPPPEAWQALRGPPT